MTTRIAFLLCVTAAFSRSELSTVRTLSTEPFGSTYEILTFKASFMLDPRVPANKAIVDLEFAPRNAKGLVEATADLVLIQPRNPAQANGTTLFEVSNRGGFSALAAFNASRAGRMEPGNAFLMRQGYTIAWLGWQFDLPKTATFRIDVPIANVRSLERWYTFGKAASTAPLNQPGGYCALASPTTPPRLYARTALNSPRRPIPQTEWDFPDPCSIRIEGGFKADTLYELIYEAQGSPVAGIGPAAIRDFISWMKRKDPQRARRVVGYGYSQSARLLRQMLYDGFNADEKGQIVFDGLLLAAGGSGRGSFNHRFADPGMAGNSTEGIDEPVDIFPFSDVDQTDSILRRTDGLLHRATQQRVVPKIFHLSTATEYWARAASLLHTTVDGTQDVRFPPSSRMYFFPGTPHSPAAFPPVLASRAGQFMHPLNPFGMLVTFPALLTAMQSWLAESVDPPRSRYPTLEKGDLVGVEKLTRVSGLAWPTFVPQVTRLDLGSAFYRTGVITKQPPERGPAYPLLVPQIDADGNETSGIRLPHVVAPLATVTGWNQSQPTYHQFSKLGGLPGSYIPFTWAKVQERYGTKDTYLQKIRAAAETLVKERFLLPADVDGIVERASREWDWLAAAP